MKVTADELAKLRVNLTDLEAQVNALDATGRWSAQSAILRERAVSLARAIGEAVLVESTPNLPRPGEAP